MSAVTVACRLVQMSSNLYQLSKDCEKYKAMGFKEHSRSAMAKGILLVTNLVELAALGKGSSYSSLVKIKLVEMAAKVLEVPCQFLKVRLENSHLGPEATVKASDSTFTTLLGIARCFIEAMTYNEKNCNQSLPKLDISDEELSKLKLPKYKITTGGREGTPHREICGEEPATRERLKELHEEALWQERFNECFTGVLNVGEAVGKMREAAIASQQAQERYRSAAEDLAAIV